MVLDNLTQFKPKFLKKFTIRVTAFLIGAPSGSGLLTIVELAIFKELQDEESGKVLDLAPNELIC